MTGFVGIASARAAAAIPPLLVIPAPDGTRYATEAAARAVDDSRRHSVLCSTHGLIPVELHPHHTDTPPDDDESITALARLIRAQIGWFTTTYVESWCWPEQDAAMAQSRRVTIIRTPMWGMNILERHAWLSREEP